MTAETLIANLRATLRSGRIVKASLPLVPEISLYLISEDYPRGPLPYDEMLAIMEAPAYWSFCWASGQVLARYILDHREHFRHKTVLDFGCGSGVVAIASAMVGAKCVIACDIDPAALAATAANASINGVRVELLADIDHLNRNLDIAIAADVLYDRDNISWLDRLPRLANDVIVADSRIKNLTVHGYEIIGRALATTVPDLGESAEFNDVKVYRALAHQETSE